MPEVTSRFVQRLSYAWRRHRWRLFGPLLWHNVIHLVRRTVGRGHRDQKAEVDLRLGLDTHQVESTALMTVDGDNLVHGYRYQPVDEVAFESLMGLLDIDFGNYTFVDYGSGKGRALFLAVPLGFRKVVGVEYAQPLHEAALRNLQAARSHLPGAERVDCIWADATRCEPPAGPLACFMYNPFDATVMKALLGRLMASLQRSPRDILVVYANPEQRQVFDRHPAVTLLHDHEHGLIYRLDARRAGCGDDATISGAAGPL